MPRSFIDLFRPFPPSSPYSHFFPLASGVQ